jgi:hypothetical protein
VEPIQVPGKSISGFWMANMYQMAAMVAILSIPDCFVWFLNGWFSDALDHTKGYYLNTRSPLYSFD